VTDADQERVLRATRRIVDEVVPLPDADTGGARGSGVAVMGVPADDPIDELALSLFARLASADTCRITTLSPALLSSEILERVERERPRIVCIGAAPPGGLAQTRYLAKRLREKVPGVVLLAGRWGGDGYVEEARAAIVAAGAHDVATTLAESHRQLLPLVQLDAPETPPAPSAAVAA
jgi:hypothetical protein